MGIIEKIISIWRPAPQHETGGASPVGADVTALKTRIAALEMDIEERERQIAAMKKEFDRLERQAKSDQEQAGQDETRKIAAGLAPLLSQMVTMRAMSQGGTDIKIADLFKLFGKMEGVLARCGIEAIGVPGETTAFDTRLHQRMSGGDVRDGDAVAVRFVGYRHGETIMVKAMVSRKE